MDRISAFWWLCFTVLCFFIHTNVALSQVQQGEWNITLYPVSKPSESTVEIGKDAIKIEFVGYNNDRRGMYNTQVEIFLPDVVDYYPKAKYVVDPPFGATQKDHYVKWDNVEQHLAGLSKEGALSYHDGWWFLVHVWGVKPGTGKATAKLSWEDKAGNKYSREYLLKTITVIGKEEPPTPSRPNQGPKVKIIIFDKSPGKVKFYIDADDREGDTIAGYQWKIDEHGWSGWIDENVIEKDGLAAGKHTIFAQAKDDKGNEGEIAKKKFKIEEVEIVEDYGPRVSISEPSYPFRNSLSIVRFELNATDPEGDAISGFRWRIDEQPWSSGWGTGIVITDSLTPGKHTISAQAKDDKGNEGEVGKREFKIEKGQGPMVTISEPSYPNPNDLSTVRFSLNAEDKEGDAIVGYRGKIDGRRWTTWLEGKAGVITLNNLTPGNHVFYAQAKDDKGNEGEVARKEFIVGKLGPHIGLNLVRGEIAPWGEDLNSYGIGWGYEIYGEYYFSSKLSFGVSGGFQKYDAKLKDKGYFKIVPLYARVAYSLRTSNRRFQLKPFLGAGLNLYRFAGSTDYHDITAYGVETGLIMEYALNSPTSPNNVSFILQGGVNYTHSDFQSTFTSMMLGVKFRL